MNHRNFSSVLAERHTVIGERTFTFIRSFALRCRRIKNGTQVHRPRVGEKSGSLRSKKRSRGCARKSSCSAGSKQRGTVPRSRANRREEEVAWKKAVRWNLMRRQIVRKSRRSKRKACSGSCGISRSVSAGIPFSRTDRRRFGKKSWKKLIGKGRSFCQNIKRCRRGHKSCRACGTSRGTASRTLATVKNKRRRSTKRSRKGRHFTETRFRVLSERSGDTRKAAAAEVENEVQTLQAGEEKRGCSASQSNGCCFVWEQVFAFGETRAASSIQFMQQEFVRQYRTPDAPEQWAGGEEKGAWERDWDDEKEQSGWNGSGGGGNPSMPLRVGNMAKWRRMESCDKGRRAG